MERKLVSLLIKGTDLNRLSNFGGIAFSAKDNISSPNSFGLHPKASLSLSSDPNKLVATGKDDPLTFSKSKAGPSCSMVLQLISLISRIGSTSVFILFKSPILSRKLIYELKSSKFCPSKSIYPHSSNHFLCELQLD